jgi:hypothetical protein
MRKLLLAIGIAMVLGFVVVVIKAVQERAAGDSTPGVTSPAATTTTTSSASPASTAVPTSARESTQAAVKAAADALENLTGAFLMNNDQRWGVVRKTVAPRYRRRYNRQMNKAANPSSPDKAFWGTGQSGWGYESRLQAFVRSDYHTDVQYYHVDKFRPGLARVALYYVTQYQDANDTSHPSSSMQVLTMRWANKRWLYVRQRNPAKNRTPGIKPSDDLSPKEIEELYKLYLEPKGFVKYPN